MTLMEARQWLRETWPRTPEETRQWLAVAAQFIEPNWGQRLWWEQYNEYLKSDAWQAKRQQVIARCRDRCEGCGEHPVAEVHHLTYDHVGAELLFELVGLCNDCHRRTHGGKRGFEEAAE